MRLKGSLQQREGEKESKENLKLSSFITGFFFFIFIAATVPQCVSINLIVAVSHVKLHRKIHEKYCININSTGLILNHSKFGIYLFIFLISRRRVVLFLPHKNVLINKKVLKIPMKSIPCLYTKVSDRNK